MPSCLKFHVFLDYRSGWNCFIHLTLFQETKISTRFPRYTRRQHNLCMQTFQNFSEILLSYVGADAYKATSFNLKALTWGQPTDSIRIKFLLRPHTQIMRVCRVVRPFVPAVQLHFHHFAIFTAFPSMHFAMHNYLSFLPEQKYANFYHANFYLLE